MVAERPQMSPPAETKRNHGVEFYCGLGNTSWNGHPPAPGALACVSPITGRTAKTRRMTSIVVPADTQVIQDSGAFSDSWDMRLTFEAALDRQIVHAERYQYANRIVARATYDLLIDEVWDEGNRYKRRWSVADAEEAVTITVQAAEFLDQHRHNLPLIVSAQGVDAPQYLDCVNRLMPYIDLSRDYLGLGGWCIIGKYPKQMMPVFADTIRQLIPYIAKRGIQRVHIWGVIYPRALGSLLWWCNQHDIKLSTDSAGPYIQPAFGNWGYGEWYERLDPNHPTPLGILRAQHVAKTREWLRNLNATQWHKDFDIEPTKHIQLSLF